MKDSLNEGLAGTDICRIAVGYFSAYGFEAIQEILRTIPDFRLILGSPQTIAALSKTETSERRVYFEDGKLDLKDTIRQRLVAKNCINWLKNDKVKIQKYRASNFLHAKIYHSEKEEGNNTAWVGSSNFTGAGMGNVETPNIEGNLKQGTPKATNEISEWFDELWLNEKLTVDAKQEVIDALSNLYQNYPPQMVYYKCLFEQFKDEIDNRKAILDNNQSLADSEIWECLYEFQQQAVYLCLTKISKFNGCILADSVGLGKTFTALGVIKHFETQDKNVLVICPKRLEENWQQYRSAAARENNRFKKDRFDYNLIFHTDIGRENGTRGLINFENFSGAHYDLIVIDESHNFRNKEGSRYKYLLENMVKKGSKTKLLLLSATPVNTKLTDLHNQIKLITHEKDSHFAESLSIPSVSTVIKDAEKQLTETTASIPETLTQGLFGRLLSAITIARSRQQIVKLGKDDLNFPKHRKPINLKPETDKENQLNYGDLYKNISDLNMAVYNRAAYLDLFGKVDDNFNRRKGREAAIAALMTTLLLKRAESSVFSLKKSLSRLADNIERNLSLAEQFMKDMNSSVVSEESYYGLDDLDDMLKETDVEIDLGKEVVVKNSNSKILEDLPNINLPTWAADLRNDLTKIGDILKVVSLVTVTRDGKFFTLLEELKKITQKSKKVLIFTAYKDTAHYVYEQIEATMPKVNKALVTGDSDLTITNVKNVKNSYESILDSFSPHSRGLDNPNGEEQLQLVVATDCISEGQNLQDCDTVINYDIHWNPIRLIQRFGRIDRLGSQHSNVGMINFWPPEDLNTLLKLEERVRERAIIASATGSGENVVNDELLTDESEVTQFRLKQFEDYQNDEGDLDAVLGPSLQELTLDFYLTQLLNFLDLNRASLEVMPAGVLGVIPDNELKDEKSGIIFCFRNKSDSKHNNSVNQTFPFHYLRINCDGTKHLDKDAGKTLDFLSKKVEPLTKEDSKAFRLFDQGFKLNNNVVNLMLDQLLSVNLEGRKSKWGQEPRGAFLETEAALPKEHNLALTAWFIIHPSSIFKVEE